METYIGMSCYAGFHPRFPVARFMRQYPADMERPAIALVFNTFGRDTRILEAWKRKFGDRYNLLEIHWNNECSRRAGRKLRYEFRSDLSSEQYSRALERRDPLLLSQIRRRTRVLLRLVRPYRTPTTALLISTGLEGNISDQGHMVLADTIRRASRKDKFLIARSPVAKGQTNLAGADILELHCAQYCKPFWGVLNFDGYSINFGDGEDFFQHLSPARAADTFKDCIAAGSFACFGWSATQQGLNGVANWNHDRPHRSRDFIVTDSAIKTSPKILGGGLWKMRN